MDGIISTGCMISTYLDFDRRVEKGDKLLPDDLVMEIIKNPILHTGGVFLSPVELAP